MTIRWFVCGLFAACTVVSAHAEVGRSLPTDIRDRFSNQRLIPLQAQAPAAGASAKVSVEGCVERAQRNGSVGGTGLGTTSSPNTADRDANSSEMLDVFQLSNAQPIPTTAADQQRTSYALEGHEQELGGHTGHRIQVTGTLLPVRRAGTSVGGAVAGATAAGIRHIRVDSFKMISAACNNPAPK